MKYLRLISAFICLLLSIGHAKGRDTLMFRGLSHRITTEIRPTYNIPTHGYYRGYNDSNEAIPSAGALHLKYGFSLNPESRLGSLYPTAYQGIGIGVQSFYHHSMTGTPVLIYIYQGSRIADLSDKVSIGYEWNLGASYGWKINDVVSSGWNIYINVGIPVTWHISHRWDLSLAPEYTHYSNGDTKFPNGGANTVGCRIGLTAKFNESQSVKAPEKTWSVKRRMSYDLTISAGWRADRTSDGGKLLMLNQPFITSGLCFNPLYRFNRYLSAGGALDLMYDSSADLSITDGHIAYPGTASQLSAGISARGELTMPFFSVNIGAGYGFSSGNDLKGFYTTYALKTFVTEHLFINIGYRLGSRQYTHNLMFGMGIRL